MNELEVFTAALELADSAARESYLEEACSGCPELRKRLDVLLDNASHPSGFLETNLDNRHAALDELLPERIGSLIGPYKLLEQIGEGGMGVVYMAQQSQPVKRRVALKLIKLGMDTRQVTARFEAERQALALMDHPHIARVFDAGATEAGRPYFVMELVHGVPITDYCDREQLDTRQRLGLIIDVCRAVQHAHQKAIIHRDLKPSNVLVTLHDGEAVVKVIDFGVAKALDQELTERTLFTQFSQMVGTPLYMSPEQAAANAVDVDTRSDIYSLGVLLYELLTGTTPFDRDLLKNAGIDELRRIIREDDPPRPSARISTLHAAGRSTVSLSRDGDPRKLGKLMRGELDWIVMKALEKDRNRRYESANALAADVQRYLHDEPVMACPPSGSYRLKKFAHRNRVALATFGLVTAALLAGTGISLWQAHEATMAHQLAEGHLKRADASFQTALEDVDRMLARVADESLRNVPQAELARQKILEDAADFYRGFLAQRSDDATLRYQSASVTGKLGDIYVDLGKSKEGGEAYLQASLALEKLHAEVPDDIRYRTQLAMAFNRLGFHVGTTPLECEKSFHRAIVLLQPVVNTIPADMLVDGISPRGQLANAYCSRSLKLISLGRLEEAEHGLRAAIALCEEVPLWGQELLANCHLNLATLHQKRGTLASALDAIETAIGVREAIVKSAPGSAHYRYELGRDWLACGRYLVEADRLQEAERAFHHALDHGKRIAQDFPNTRHYKSLVHDAQLALIPVSLKLGHKDEVAPIIDELTAAFPEGIPPGVADVLAETKDMSGEELAARELIRRAQRHEKEENWEQALVDFEAAIRLSPENLYSRERAALLHLRFEHFDQAISGFDEILRIDPNHWSSYAYRSNIYLEQKQYDKALADSCRALELYPDSYFALRVRSFVHRELKQDEKSLGDLDRLIVMNPNVGEDYFLRGEAHLTCAAGPSICQWLTEEGGKFCD